MRKEIAAVMAELEAPHAEEVDALIETAAQLVQKLRESFSGPTLTDEDAILRQYNTMAAQHIGEMIGAVQAEAFRAAFSLHDLRQTKRQGITRELRRPALAPRTIAHIPKQ